MCGTDLHAAHGRLPVPNLPVVMGHEGAGVVETVGEGVSEFRVGERVLSLLMITKLVSVFKHYGTIEEAVESFG